MTSGEDDLRRARLLWARLLWDYLRLGVAARPADCLLVFGGHDLGVAGRAADLYHARIASLSAVKPRPCSAGRRARPRNAAITAPLPSSAR